jgi:hypothetical protein
MNDDERAIARNWLEKNRGAETQEHLAAAITAVTGWHIGRDRYSKYETGATPFGKVVLKHFIDYWKSRGVDAPDLAPEPSGATETGDSLASAIQALADELREWRTKDRDRISELEAAVKRLAGRALAGSRTPKPTTPRVPRKSTG